MEIRGYLAQLGPIRPAKLIWDEIDNNPFFCPDPDQVAALETFMDALRKSGDSIAREDAIDSERCAGELGRAGL